MSRAEGESYDCVVVGAGPAGALTARELGRRGLSVLLVDRSSFPRYKVCGCCISPRAISVLEAAGLGVLISTSNAVPLTTMELACGGRRALIGGRDGTLGVAISRRAFDMALILAAQDSGVRFESMTTVALVQSGQGRGPCVLSLRSRENDEEVRARLVVSATGLGDSLSAGTGGTSSAEPASKVGAGAMTTRIPDGYEPGRIYMASAEGGYVGMVAIETGQLDLAAALCPIAMKRVGGIGPLVGRILRSAGMPEVPGLADLPWKGTPALTRMRTPVVEGRIFRVGDAAGYVEPFTGEGMAWALAGAVRLARILAECGDDELAVKLAGEAWTMAHRREVSGRQWICRSARVALRSPWLMRSVVMALDACPSLARPVLRSLHRVA